MMKKPYKSIIALKYDVWNNIKNKHKKVMKAKNWDFMEV